MKKTVALIAALCCCQLALTLLQACCGDVPNVCYTIKSFSLEALDNADSTAATPENNTVLAKAFLLRLIVNNDKKVCSRTGVKFINSVYAFTKDCEKETYNDKVDSLAIVSNSDFDASHRAGDVLNAYFKMPRRESVYSQEGVDTLDMYLITPPEAEGTHIFSLKLHLSDGRTLETHTNPVKLVK